MFSAHTFTCQHKAAVLNTKEDGFAEGFFGYTEPDLREGIDV